MKTINTELSLFGDLYYNSSSKEIKEFALSLKNNKIDDISAYLKIIMQDILAHLGGASSFMDACMVRDKLQFECLINNRLGKKKLVEFFSLLEELNKLGIKINELTFEQNKNDYFLSKVLTNRNTKSGILLPYLSFYNLLEFFEMVVMLATILPMASTKEDFNTSIPDPTDFNFQNTYYESIDYLQYYRDDIRHKGLLDKHLTKGREISLIDWIKKYQDEQSLLIEEDDENEIKTRFAEFITKEKYDFSALDIEFLNDTFLNKEEEVISFLRQVQKQRESIRLILENQDISLTDQEIDNLEYAYVFENWIKQLTGKKRKHKDMYDILYATIISSLEMSSTILKKEEISQSRIQSEDEYMINQSFIDPIEESNIDIESTRDENIFKPNFVIGETFSSNVPFYNSPTSDMIFGFLNNEVMTIGYYATLERNGKKTIFRSFCNQEAIDKFLRLCHDDFNEIKWRVAVTQSDNSKALEHIQAGELIPQEYATCYIDCEFIKKLKR